MKELSDDSEKSIEKLVTRGIANPWHLFVEGEEEREALRRILIKVANETVFLDKDEQPTFDAVGIVSLLSVANHHKGMEAERRTILNLHKDVLFEAGMTQIWFDSLMPDEEEE